MFWRSDGNKFSQFMFFWNSLYFLFIFEIYCPMISILCACMNVSFCIFQYSVFLYFLNEKSAIFIFVFICVVFLFIFFDYNKDIYLALDFICLTILYLCVIWVNIYFIWGIWASWIVFWRFSLLLENQNCYILLSF